MNNFDAILEKLEEVRRAVVRLETKLAATESHELRIRELELWRAKATGMAVGIGVMSSGITSLVLWVLSTIFGAQ